MLLELAALTGSLYWMHRDRANQALATSGQFLGEAKKAFTGEIRQRQQLAMNPDARREMAAARRTRNRDLGLSLVAVSTALLAPAAPVLAVVSVGSMLFLARRGFRMAWRDLASGRVLTTYVVGIVFFLGLIAKGFLLLTALMGIVGNFYFRLIRHIEQDTSKQLTNVFAQRPNKVWVARDGLEIELDFGAIQIGDLVILQAGDRIPVDGVIRDGEATLDQHWLTGESQPVERGVGERVLAATLLLRGKIQVEVEQAGEHTVAAKIGQVLRQTQHYKENLIARGRQTADRLLPVTVGVAAATWPLLGSTAALSVLFAYLGTNMITLGPLSVLGYLHIFSSKGVLIKDGRILEILRQVDTVVFDKTGTLTLEQPRVAHVHAWGNWDATRVLALAATAEFRQTHPIAKAILAHAEARGVKVSPPEDADYRRGHGIQVQIHGQLIHVGSARFFADEGISLAAKAIPESAAGGSLVYVAVDRQAVGGVELHPDPRPEAVAMVDFLRQRGLQVHILSGDHEAPTRALAQRLGIAHYSAQTLPEQKADWVRQLREQGRFVCFIGDGINDAIALKSAQVSISLNGASTAATDTAQIILMDGTLNHLKPLFELADEFEQTMQRNLATSLIPGLLFIGGVYFWHFRLIEGVVAYYLGSSLGVANSLWPLYKHRDDLAAHAQEKTVSPLTEIASNVQIAE